MSLKTQITSKQISSWLSLAFQISPRGVLRTEHLFIRNECEHQFPFLTQAKKAPSEYTVISMGCSVQHLCRKPWSHLLPTFVVRSQRAPVTTGQKRILQKVLEHRKQVGSICQVVCTKPNLGFRTTLGRNSFGTLLLSHGPTSSSVLVLRGTLPTSCTKGPEAVVSEDFRDICAQVSVICKSHQWFSVAFWIKSQHQSQKPQSQASFHALQIQFSAFTITGQLGHPCLTTVPYNHNQLP